MSAQAAGQGDPEAAAWADTRLSLLELQVGRRKEAARACDAAISIQPDYAPGLLACGRVMTAEGRESAAIQLFQHAAKLNPLPEYQWILADPLRAANRTAEADDVLDIAVIALLSDLRDPANLKINDPFKGDYDGVRSNDMGFHKVFPYESTPQNGRVPNFQK